MILTKVAGAMLAPILIAVALGGAAGITTDGVTNSVFAQNKSLRLPFQIKKKCLLQTHKQEECLNLRQREVV
jgi:hypothetical protein